MRAWRIALAFAVITGSLVAMASQATITVTKPAAGESWMKGTTRTITWTKSGQMPGRVRISLRDARGMADRLVIEEDAPNTGSYQWALPPDIADGQYRVRVTVRDAAVSDDGDLFRIVSPPRQIGRPLTTVERPGRILKLPALSISNVTLKPTNEGYLVTFGYKNSGTAPLPRSSEMPVKPNFRVLLDGREVNRGSLIIPAFPAEPGWEVQTSYGCDIRYEPGVLPNPGMDVSKNQPIIFNMRWTLPSWVTVTINENKVAGMDSDSQTYSLKKMALDYAHDVLVMDVSVDWNKRTIITTVRVDGQTAGYNWLWVNNRQLPFPFTEYVDLVPGKNMYTITKKEDGLKYAVNGTHGEIWAWLAVKKNIVADWKDIDHRNNVRPFNVPR